MNFVPTNTMGTDLYPPMRGIMCFLNSGMLWSVISTYLSRPGISSGFILLHQGHVALPYTVMRPSTGNGILALDALDIDPALAFLAFHVLLVFLAFLAFLAFLVFLVFLALYIVYDVLYAYAYTMIVR